MKNLIVDKKAFAGGLISLTVSAVLNLLIFVVEKNGSAVIYHFPNNPVVFGVAVPFFVASTGLIFRKQKCWLVVLEVILWCLYLIEIATVFFKFDKAIMSAWSGIRWWVFIFLFLLVVIPVWRRGQSTDE